MRRVARHFFTILAAMSLLVFLVLVAFFVGKAIGPRWFEYGTHVENELRQTNEELCSDRGVVYLTHFYCQFAAAGASMGCGGCLRDAC